MFSTENGTFTTVRVYIKRTSTCEVENHSVVCSPLTTCHAAQLEKKQQLSFSYSHPKEL